MTAIDDGKKVERPVPAQEAIGRTNGQRGSRDVKIHLRGKMADLYTGELTVADMDDEELGRMQFKDKNGRFTGTPPSVLPTALVNMMRAELVRRAVSIREEQYTKLMNELVRIALSSEKDSDRLRAIQEIANRTEGKPTEHLEISNGSEKPFELTLMKSVKIKRMTVEEPDGTKHTLEERHEGPVE